MARPEATAEAIIKVGYGEYLIPWGPEIREKMADYIRGGMTQKAVEVAHEHAKPYIEAWHKGVRDAEDRERERQEQRRRAHARQERRGAFRKAVRRRGARVTALRAEKPAWQRVQPAPAQGTRLWAR
jgi:hypothetical protein